MTFICFIFICQNLQNRLILKKEKFDRESINFFSLYKEILYNKKEKIKFNRKISASSKQEIQKWSINTGKLAQPYEQTGKQENSEFLLPTSSDGLAKTNYDMWDQ